jgi:hypothetical protein
MVKRAKPPTHATHARLASRVLAIFFAGAVTTCGLDPVHDDEVSDLGPEAPGIPQGPLHRAGQPCLACHASGTSPTMSAGGTIYGVLGDATPLASANVTLTAANGATFTAQSNSVGNFYVLASDFNPAFPVTVQVTYGTLTATMSSIIGRDGSCASCHADPASRVSAGPVYVAPNASLLPTGGSQ